VEDVLNSRVFLFLDLLYLSLFLALFLYPFHRSFWTSSFIFLFCVALFAGIFLTLEKVMGKEKNECRKSWRS
jgi:hypothetical protein